MSSSPCNIIVVGAGPSGLLLSLLLARDGISVLLLEADHQLNDQPRATHYAPPAIRELRRAGILEDVGDEGFMPQCLSWRNLEGTQLTAMDLNDLGDYPDRMICLPLNKLGRILHKHLLRQPTSKILWSTKVKSIGQDSQKAWVETETVEEIKKFEASYIIGCDGASSRVRRSLFGEMNFPGYSWEQQVVATNVYYDFDQFGWDDVNYIIHPEHWYMAARISKDGLWRVSYGELAGMSREELIARQPLKFEQMLPGSPKPDQYEIINVSPYRTHQRCAEKMRVGRILLAADAAHLCNPFGGMGLTGGIVDVGGLYDCLAGIFQGKVNDSILEKYDDIRRAKYHQLVDPISRENLQRLFATNPETALEDDKLLQQLVRAKDDKEFSRQLQLVSHDPENVFSHCGYFTPPFDFG